MRVFSNINCPLKLKYADMYFYFNPFSVQSRFTMYTITLQCTRIYVHMFQMRAQFILCK